MAHLVRDHVGLRKLASLAADIAAAEARRDLIEERGVEINLLVGRTVERSHGAARFSAATGLRRAAIEHQHGRAIGSALLGEDLLPLQLGAAEHLADEATHLVLRSGGAPRRGRRLHLRLTGTVQDLATALASILDVAAFRQIVQAHGFASLPAARHTAAAAVDLCLPASINASASIYVPGNSFPIAARPG